MKLNWNQQTKIELNKLKLIGLTHNPCFGRGTDANRNNTADNDKYENADDEDDSNIIIKVIVIIITMIQLIAVVMRMEIAMIMIW